MAWNCDVYFVALLESSWDWGESKSSQTCLVQHSLLKVTQWRQWQSTTPPPQPISCEVGANPPPHNQQLFTHWQPLLRPDGACHSTWLLHLINWLNRTVSHNGRGRGKDQRSNRAGAPALTHATSTSKVSQQHFTCMASSGHASSGL